MSDVTPEMRATLANAPFPRLLGFRLLELAEGYAKVGVAVRSEHANFLGATDGAVVMCLADYAGACACNTLGVIRVAVQYNIHFLTGSILNDELTAEARTFYAGRTMAVTEMSVTNADDKVLARATATTITRPNQNLPQR